MTHYYGLVRIDLRPHTDDIWPLDRVGSQIKLAVHAPAGAAVTFMIASGQLVDYGGIAYVRDHGQHLGSITVECPDAYTVQRWVAAFRDGAPW